MPSEDRLAIARDCYRAYEVGDPSVLHARLTDDFRFFSPADVGIYRAEYFERCWPNAELIEAFEYKRLQRQQDLPGGDLLRLGRRVGQYIAGP